MLYSTIVMALLALVFIALAYAKGGGVHIQGLKAAGKMMVDIAPMLFFAFIVAGIVPLLVPQEFMDKYLGAESGWRGLFIGALAGGLSPGGPFVSMPIALGLLRSGAGVGVMVAYLTGWSLLAISRIPLEVGILGWKFALIRFACTFFFAPIAGYIANLLFSGIKLDVR